MMSPCWSNAQIPGNTIDSKSDQTAVESDSLFRANFLFERISCCIECSCNCVLFLVAHVVLPHMG